MMIKRIKRLMMRNVVKHLQFQFKTTKTSKVVSKDLFQGQCSMLEEVRGNQAAFFNKGGHSVFSQDEKCSMMTLETTDTIEKLLWIKCRPLQAFQETKKCGKVWWYFSLHKNSATFEILWSYSSFMRWNY